MAKTKPTPATKNAKNLKTEWNLGLLYKGDNDPQIEKDMRVIEQACTDFEHKYKGKPFTKTAESLVAALDDFEELSKIYGGHKPWWYFRLKSDLNSDDKVASARATQYEQKMSEAVNKILFFSLDIGKIPAKAQVQLLKHPLVKSKNYTYALQRIFNQAKHNLSEGEEQLESLLSQTSYTMWINAAERLLNQQTVLHKGKQVPINTMLSQISEMPLKERRDAHKKVNALFKSISQTPENEINAVYNYKKIMDKRRGYAMPYSATILSYENNEQAIERFVSLVTSYYKISHRFYTLHTKLLGVKRASYADRAAKIGDIRAKFDFSTSVSMLRTVLGKVDPEYVTFLDRFLANGQIDVYPKKGKVGGAYHWHMVNLPAFLLLNHTDNVRSLETFAHEVGHSIHGELSSRQTPCYQSYSTATAEVASTFFEQLMADEVEKQLSEKEQMIMLHNRIKGDIQTIFRQVACYNFELELHQKIRKEGQVSAREMAHTMSKHMKAYLGGSFDVTEDDGYFFVAWSHIRRFFYVYTYAYGQLISRALYEKWKQDPSYALKIKQFLSAGSSMSPEDIFKSIGIDTSSNEFFEAGLKGIERDIERLEALAAKKQK